MGPAVDAVFLPATPPLENLLRTASSTTVPAA